MDQNKLVQLMQAQAALLTRLAASQDALERAVLALADTHPNKIALLQSLEARLEPDATQDDQGDAYEEHRERLLAAIKRVCAP